MFERLSKTELAAAFRVSKPTIDAWIQRGMPHKAQGGPGRAWAFDLAGCVAWRIEDEIGRRIDAGGEDVEALDLTTERAKLARAQRLKSEYELGILQRHNIPADEVERVFGGMIKAFRERALALPTQLTAQVAAETDPGTVADLIEGAVYECLTELAEYDPAQHRPPEAETG